MTNQNGPNRPSKSSDLDELGARLNAVKAKHKSPEPDKKTDGTMLGVAWRMSTELVVSVVVGLGLGYGIDTFFGSKPWGMLIGLCFGFAAGIMAVLRASKTLDEQNAGVPIGNDMPDDEDE